ncbi:hypothetical protein FIBSPDRAFT_916934 [Athelia psychrophila]|uniref:Sphingolipid long chain base-responsive protein LSP1 n=1 Tax=Athelia psychrophila TaxID=1759441 RepID=A0A166U3Y8_9AGAM|nr:hypothetical protein FIBSPDRAFT_916934 [Fibularhizoctonia sp. CBS 109695]
MASFLSSLTDKAQAAINASPLGAHIPGHRPTSPSAEQKPASTSAPFGQFESIQHQLKAFGQQYQTTTPVQKIITTEKGVAIDFDSLSRNSKTQSKELYTWGQGESDDLKDVTDRLAYFNFVQGSLASTLAAKLDAARGPVKELRDAETAITPRRNIRAGIALSISRLEHEQAKGSEGRLVDLRNQLKRNEDQDESKEKEIAILKRKAVRESEQLKWDAIREYAEKLVLISQAAGPVISALPATPPSDAEPYKGAQSTAATRASLQRALDNYKTGHINLAPESAADSDFDSRSFGESHASELSNIGSGQGTVSGIGPLTPPQGSSVLPGSPPSAFKSSDSGVPNRSSQSPPINPIQLNNSPAPIPIPTSGASTTAAVPIGSPENLSPSLPPILPTVAETGMPVSAGAAGPGPASGSLLDIKNAASDAGPRSGGLSGKQTSDTGYGQIGGIGAAVTSAASLASATSGNPGKQYESAEDEKKRLQREDRERLLNAQGPPPAASGQFESAEDEKKRLQREDRERLLNAQGPPPPAASGQFESAEEEKKRLERQEREKILNAGGSGPSGAAQGPPKDGDDSDLPAYQAF